MTKEEYKLATKEEILEFIRKNLCCTECKYYQAKENNHVFFRVGR